MNTLAVLIVMTVLVTFANGQSDTPLTNSMPILLHSEIRDDAGQYSLTYSTATGQSHSEQALLKRNTEGTGNILVKQGSYSYIGPDGKPVTVMYVADENGFQPIGTHLPQPVQPLPVA